MYKTFHSSSGGSILPNIKSEKKLTGRLLRAKGSIFDLALVGHAKAPLGPSLTPQRNPIVKRTQKRFVGLCTERYHSY